MKIMSLIALYFLITYNNNEQYKLKVTGISLYKVNLILKYVFLKTVK
jgi:hypothetical protein